MSDITIRLQPKQKDFRKSLNDYPITLYGGAKGGGKSKGLREIFLLRRFEQEKTHAAIFRRTYPELEGNHIRPLFESFPGLRTYYHESKKLLELPNGSTIQFCHCKNEEDVSLYQGREFDDLGIDEITQWSESMFRTLHGSNRSSKPGVKPRCALTGNPGGIGHSWVKRIFIERRFSEIERAEDYSFIPALVDDNPALIKNDPDYVRRLEANPNKALRDAYRWGSWDIHSGQFFPELRRDVHFIKPFEIPAHWTRFAAYDFGFNHPTAFGWFAVDEDGCVYQYRELVEAGLRVDQICEKVLRFEDTKQCYPVIAGHDCWAKKTAKINAQEQSPPTIAEEFMKAGIPLKRAIIDRIQGAAQLRKYLAHNESTKPQFFIFQSCPITYDCLTRMENDPNRLEDVLKVDALDGDIYAGDDAYDMVRYALMSRPVSANRLKPQHKWGSPEWAKQQTQEMEEAAEEYFANLEKAEEGFGLDM
jgi:phage terminase large subunit